MKSKLAGSSLPKIVSSGARRHSGSRFKYPSNTLYLGQNLRVSLHLWLILSSEPHVFLLVEVLLILSTSSLWNWVHKQVCNSIWLRNATRFGCQMSTSREPDCDLLYQYAIFQASWVLNLSVAIGALRQSLSKTLYVKQKGYCCKSDVWACSLFCRSFIW